MSNYTSRLERYVSVSESFFFEQGYICSVYIYIKVSCENLSSWILIVSKVKVFLDSTFETNVHCACIFFSRFPGSPKRHRLLPDLAWLTSWGDLFIDRPSVHAPHSIPFDGTLEFFFMSKMAETNGLKRHVSKWPCGMKT